MSHAVFLQYYVGTCKNNTSPKITSAFTLDAKDVSKLRITEDVCLLGCSTV
jgi:hypothetical protein